MIIRRRHFFIGRVALIHLSVSCCAIARGGRGERGANLLPREGTVKQFANIWVWGLLLVAVTERYWSIKVTGYLMSFRVRMGDVRVIFIRRIIL